MEGVRKSGEGLCFAWPLTKAVQSLKPTVRKDQRDKWLSQAFENYGISEPPSPELWDFGDFVVHHPLAVRYLQQKLNLRLLVVKTTRNKNFNVPRLLYDGRHGIFEDAELEEMAPLRCIYLGSDNRLLQHADTPERFSPLTLRSYKRKLFGRTQPLWQLLGFQKNALHSSSPPAQEPQSFSELVRYVADWGRSGTHVVIQFASGLLKTSPTHTWFRGPVGNPSTPIVETIHLLAYPTRNYSLAFVDNEDPGAKRATRRGQQVQQDYERYREAWKQLKEKEKREGTANARQANCAAVVHAAHTGLNLVQDIGLISLEELRRLSRQMGDTFGSLHIFVCEKNHLRHVTYCDAGTSFCQEVSCFENDCVDLNRAMTPHQQTQEDRRRNEAAQAMLSFWQKVWDRRAHWIQQRQTLLQPLIQHLETLLSKTSGAGVPLRKKRKQEGAPGNPHADQDHPCRQLTSPYSRCLAELKKMIHHHRIFLFSSEDSHLHSIKFHLCHFAHKTIKRCRGVSLKAQSDDALVKLSISGLTILNLYTYFCCKADLDFFAGLWQPWCGPGPSDVVISHTNKTLRFQHVPLSDGEKQNAAAYCRERGFRFAKHVLRYWSNFSQFLLDTFGYEIHSQTTPPSASYLAFQCVWTQYLQTAGPMAQALERTKPHYEDCLRECSRGGFMFSAEAAFQQGEPLFRNMEATPASAAQSIAEYDLISAYGYAAAQSYLPSGFCTGFKQTAESSPGLERLDKRARHRTFEFRAVYKTIHQLVNRRGVAVRSVYHNYSPLGIFTLGKYNLDLAVVTEDGSVLLWNYDGYYAHSCGICPPPTAHSNQDRFVNGQTHQEVRAKTERRDAEITAWVNGINAGFSAVKGTPTELVSYAVIHDCHTPGFTTASLQQAFSSDPVLQSLTGGYEITDRCGSFFNAERFEWLVSRAQLPSDPDKADDRFTFIARAHVRIDPPDFVNDYGEADSDGSFSLGPLVVYNNATSSATSTPVNSQSGGDNDDDDDDNRTVDGRSKKTLRQRLAWQGTVVLTRDYYQWLKRAFGDRCHLDSLEWVFFYKTEPLLNAVYRKLVDMRSTTSDPVLVTFIKRLVNLSAGFYGAHSSQLHSKTTYRLVNGAPKNYAFFRHFLNPQHTVDLEEASYMLLETRPWPKVVEGRQPSRSAVPMFLTIVEYGKLRLVEIFHFLRQHLWPGRYRVLYANIDNAIIGLSLANQLDEAVAPSRQESYRTSKPLFFEGKGALSAKTPGLAELKWERNEEAGGWKFITLRTQHYCLGTAAHPEQNLHKASGWSNVSSDQAFAWAERILQGRQVQVPQIRRVHKMFGMETRDVMFHF